MAEELATAAGILAAGLGVAKPIVETGCTLIENLLGQPAKVAGGMLADHVYNWRWENRIKIANRAKQIMEADGIAARVVPKGFLLPLVDAAGDVEDPDLQELWARLIASGAASDDHQHPAFAKTLEQMDADDARVFRRRVETFNPLAGVFGPRGPSGGRWAAMRRSDAAAEARLQRLGLLVNLMGIDHGARIEVTEFGWQFARAVLPGLAKSKGPQP